MAHNLEFVNGKAQMFSVGSTWHNEGTILTAAPSDTDEALRLAGVGFLNIRKAPLTCEGEIVTTHRSLKRADGVLLGVCTASYGLIQPRDMAYTIDPIIHDKRATWEAMGSLRGGKTIWALAKLRVDPFEPTKGDAVESYLVVTQSFDKTDPLRAFYTPIRVICNNTLTAALGGSALKKAVMVNDVGEEEEIEARSIAIRHSPDAASRLDEAARILKVAERSQKSTVEIFRRMAERITVGSDAEAYLHAVIPDDPAIDDQSKRVRAREEIANLAEIGAGSDIRGVRGTLWGLYNGVTAWVDHGRGSIGGKLPSERKQLGDGARLTNSFLGVGATIKARALRVAQQLVTV